MIRVLVLVLTICTVLSACSNSEEAKVIAVAEQYWLAWQKGDEELMASVLHDRLAKRAVLKVPEDGQFPPEQKDIWQQEGYYLHDQGKSILVNKTKNKKSTKKNKRHAAIELLDRQGNAAIVKVSTGTMIDYLQLVRVNKRWYIVNVLWATGN